VPPGAKIRFAATLEFAPRIETVEADVDCKTLPDIEVFAAVEYTEYEVLLYTEFAATEQEYELTSRDMPAADRIMLPDTTEKYDDTREIPRAVPAKESDRIFPDTTEWCDDDSRIMPVAETPRHTLSDIVE
jgi:hypothetical protein